jgi:hypothetical protein
LVTVSIRYTFQPVMVSRNALFPSLPSKVIQVPEDTRYAVEENRLKVADLRERVGKDGARGVFLRRGENPHHELFISLIELFTP